ncbi:hypothetical protein [Planobispora siamensis]|uniref:hypothetical protein n=1 Tax=Planobispora siamensis TaxID=936338 RepID=UPI001951E3DA|nr:hypothetical protein [Planobispora siamensis]
MVFHLRAVPRQIRDFDPERHERPLRSLHERIRADGAFTVRNHRFPVEAVREVRMPVSTADHHGE